MGNAWCPRWWKGPPPPRELFSVNIGDHAREVLTSNRLTFRLTVLGHQAVGKSAIVNGLLGKSNRTGCCGMMLTGFDVKMDCSKTIINVNIWDLPGDNRYTNLVPFYLVGCGIALYVIDLSGDLDAKRHYHLINVIICNKPKSIIVVFNKCDLVNLRDGNVKQFMQHIALIFKGKIESVCCSAETGVGIHELNVLIANMSKRITRPVLDIIGGAINVLIIGNSNVGKTTFLHCFAYGAAPNTTRTTLNVDMTNVKVKVDERKFMVICMDTAGQERFGNLPNLYYRIAHIVLCVFDASNDIDDRAETHKRWFKIISDLEEREKPPIVVSIGMKSDLVEKPTKELCFTRDNPREIQNFVVTCVEKFVTEHNMR
jgi:small GTP-binding protein